MLILRSNFDGQMKNQHADLPSNEDRFAVKQSQFLIRTRAQRRKYFGDAIFAEPVWDICLDLFVSRLSDRRVSTSSACIASGVPATTALRYLSQMKEDGLITTYADDRDRRRIYVELSDDATATMKNYLRAEISNRP